MEKTEEVVSVCPKCRGTEVECPTCRGAGLDGWHPTPRGYAQKRCNICDGAGYVCPKCRGEETGKELPKAGTG